MKEIFDNYIENSFSGYQQAGFKLKQFEINYKKYFPKEKSAPVLDIGVGRGEMLTTMLNCGLNYRGIDISPSTVRFCQSLNLNCQVVEDTVSWLLQNKDTFSLITCLDVLEHVPRDQTIDFLKAMRAGLRNDGAVIIQVPNLQSPFGYLHHFNDFTHVSGFVEHSLAQVLIVAGYKEFEFKGFEDFCTPGIKQSIKKVVRSIYRKMIRFLRAVNANPNPEILDPVFFVVARK